MRFPTPSWSRRILSSWTCDTELIADYLEDIVGDSADEELSGVPTFIEASSWCELAPIGSCFEREGFIIYIEDDD